MNRREELLAMLQELGITNPTELNAACEEVKMDISLFAQRKEVQSCANIATHTRICPDAQMHQNQNPSEPANGAKRTSSQAKSTQKSTARCSTRIALKI